MRLYYLGWRDMRDEKVVDATLFQIQGHLSFMEKARLTMFTHTEDLFRFISGSICNRLDEDISDKQSAPFHVVQDGDFLAHFCFQGGGVVTIAITDKSYPADVVRRLIADITKGYSHNGLRDLLKKYQDPNEDKVHKISCQLEDTKKVVYENIDKLFARGEKLEELVAKTEQLSQETKTFFRRARSTRNRCFPWLDWLWGWG